MSLHQFQSGLAELIRLPEKNRETELAAFLDRFQLTQEERAWLTGLAADPKVAKYGRSMAGVRWETPELQLRLAQKLIPKSALEHLYRDVFEPQAIKVRLHELTDAFLKCLIEDPNARKVLNEAAPPSIFDVLNFERIQLKYFRGDITIEKAPVPCASLLRHSAFRILKLKSDVPQFILFLSEQSTPQDLKQGPEPRDLTILFIPDETEPGARYFEIDDEVSEFLKALGRDPLVEVSLPSSYSDLVELGICKALSSRGI